MIPKVHRQPLRRLNSLPRIEPKPTEVFFFRRIAQGAGKLILNLVFFYGVTNRRINEFPHSPILPDLLPFLFVFDVCLDCFPFATHPYPFILAIQTVYHGVKRRILFLTCQHVDCHLVYFPSNATAIWIVPCGSKRNNKRLFPGISSTFGHDIHKSRFGCACTSSKITRLTFSP